jgi:hypothetical protein
MATATATGVLEVGAIPRRFVVRMKKMDDGKLSID